VIAERFEHAEGILASAAMHQHQHPSSWLILSLFVSVLSLALPATRAQETAAQRTESPQPRRSVSDGVYSQEQAMRGQIVVETHCTECHGETLRGLEGPELAGGLFLATWSPRTLDDLYRKVAQMPKDAATSVTERERIDALAYLLQANGFAAGPAELTSDRASLSRIAMGSPTGAPVPGSMIKVAGCLRTGPENQWRLTGEQPLRLMNVFPRPAAYVDKAVLVTGLFVRDPAGDALNVISIEGAGRPCE
jgi:mono/diheme cytochrome c family protein